MGLQKVRRWREKMWQRQIMSKPHENHLKYVTDLTDAVKIFKSAAWRDYMQNTDRAIKAPLVLVMFKWLHNLGTSDSLSITCWPPQKVRQVWQNAAKESNELRRVKVMNTKGSTPIKFKIWARKISWGWNVDVNQIKWLPAVFQRSHQRDKLIL